MTQSNKNMSYICITIFISGFVSDVQPFVPLMSVERGPSRLPQQPPGAARQDRHQGWRGNHHQLHFVNSR